MPSKGQLEIFGLAIVVILIALAFLFAVQFFLFIPDQDAVRPVKESAMAANFLGSVLGATTDCYGRDVKELLQDCALSGVLECPGGVNSCFYSEQEIRKMLDASLGSWKKSYFFSITGMPDEISIGSKCPGEKEFRQNPVVIRPGYDIMVTLEICGQ
jgi:hypothetical protein